MQQSLEQYWQAVQQRVCLNCIDSDGYGNCRLTGEDACGLKYHFPRIVDTVLSVHSDRIEPYVEALRKNVCVFCKHQSPDGKCSFRSNLDCGLDRYFPLIVETIEGVHFESDRIVEAFGD
ncbi:MAG: hypothetical protein HY707_04185 [Ignavibacteriae bacterium]|nr:hypothetical protein [Ignavibacteriota bacterium]